MKNFNELQIDENILKAVTEMGITETTLVQEKAIPALKEGDDIIVLSSTGSGKTLAFAIPAIESINTEIKKPQVLVICPTRELAMQVGEEFRKLSRYLHGIKPFTVFGGQPISRQIQKLKSKPNIIIGTPGRILDHIERRTLKLETVSMLILDEADEMLKMGFREDIEKISRKLAGHRQGVLASATMNKDVLNLTKKFLRNPITIDAGNSNSPAKTISQEFITVNQKGKKILLIKMLNELNGSALVFCNTKRMVSNLYKHLGDNGITAKEIHGDMRQGERTRAMTAFKKGIVDVLIATDVAARGIDVNNITCVINYDYPSMEEYYIHRIGRTGRAKQKGKAYTFITNGEQMYNLNALSKRLDFTVTESELSNPIKLVVKKPAGGSKSSYSRNRFSQRGSSSASSRTGGRKPYGKSSDSRGSYSKSSDSKKSYSKPYAKSDDDKKSYGRSDEKKSYAKNEDRKPYRKSEDGKKSYGRSDDRKTYSKTKTFTKKPYDSDEDNYFDKKDSKKRSDGNFKRKDDRGERSYKGKSDSKKPYGSKNKGTRKNSSNNKPTSPKDYFGKDTKPKTKRPASRTKTTKK
jgi:superfamily II DNA/RNA helicase